MRMNNERITLENNIQRLIQETYDPQYAQFLTGLLYQFRQNKITKEYVMAEINRTYPIYLQRTQSSAQQNIQAKPKKNVEFAIGAGLLGVVGAVFVLIAFVMLGITFMNGLIKGLLLYGIAAGVLLFSELLIAKKMPRFAIATTGIGIGGLYLATIINYLYLQNFNTWIAAGLCVGIALLTILLGRRKDSGVLHIISFVGCYLCVLPIWQSFYLEWEEWSHMSINHYFAVITAIVLLVNLMTLFLPVKKNRSVVHIVHQCANLVFTIAFAIVSAAHTVAIGYILFYIVATLFMQGLNFKVFQRMLQKQNVAEENLGAVITYIVTSVLLLVLLVLMSLFAEFDYMMCIVLASLVLVEAILFILFRKNWLKWMAYESACFTVLAVCNLIGGYSVAAWATIGVFLLAKILSRVNALQVSELIITIFAAIWAVFSFGQADLTYAICFLGAFLLGLLAMNKWKVFYEELLLFLLGAFVVCNFRNELTLAILVCIIFAGTVGFNSLEYFRSKYIFVLNYINLGVLVFLYLLTPFFRTQISLLILLVLGAAFMLLTFKDKYGMNFRIKSILFVLFLCYMTLIWEIPFDFVKSILLMVIAIGAVIAGFIKRERKLRISGLVLCLLVCAKLIFYDFTGAATLEKTLLFLFVGVLVLGISGVYIALEKKMM